jgi:hypothetical protein
MSLRNVKSLLDAERDGFTRFSSFRKVPTQATGQGVWMDLSMSPGNPVPNYYIGTPLKFTALRQSTDGGIPHCIDTQAKSEYVRTLGIMSNSAAYTPSAMWLLDYVGYYPFIDESVTDPQLMDNSTAVPRYATGGLQIMAVCVAGQIGGQQFVVRYINQDGIERESQPHVMTTQAVNGTVLTSAGAVAGSAGPFLSFALGDTSARRITQVQMLGGDIGLMALALVRPIARIAYKSTTAALERDYLHDQSQVPEIANDAYLNLIIQPAGNMQSTQLHGYLKTIWS